MYRETMYPGLGITDLCLKRIYPLLCTPNAKTSLQDFLSVGYGIYILLLLSVGPKISQKL